MDGPIVAVGLLTRRDLDLLGPAFERAWPIDQVRGFEELLHEIDEADRRVKNAEAKRDRG